MALPRAWASESVETKVLIDERWVHSKRDHYPVTANVTINASAMVSWTQRRKAIISRSATQDPENVSNFISVIVAIPLVPWAVHAHDHHHYVYSCIQAIAQECFP